MLIQNLGSMAATPSPILDKHNVSASVENAQVAEPTHAPNAPPVDVTAAVKKPSAEKLQGVVEDINRTLKQMNKNLEFSVDKATNQTVVRMVDIESGEVIRQFPSEEALGIAQSIEQMKQGALLKQTV
jgi:flagellar protein FlaG